MTTKEEAIQFIKTLAEQKIVTKEELDLAFESGSRIKKHFVLSKKLGFNEVLYYIGGGVIFLGIAILLTDNWTTIGFGTKVLSTLGAGVIAYFTGVLFSRGAEHTETIGSAFYLISALVLPMGLYVIIDEAGFNAKSYGSQSLISATLLITYLISYFVFRKNVFTLFIILFGTWLFFSLTSIMIMESNYFAISKYYVYRAKYYEYRVLAVGLTYMLIGFTFSKKGLVSLSNYLYDFGILGFLGSALLLSDWKPNQNIFWELIYPILIFGTLFLSVYIKRKSFLISGTLFLMLYILKLTSEYFSSGLGWPLTLIITGLAMIIVGYLSFSLKKKYLNV